MKSVRVLSTSTESTDHGHVPWNTGSAVRPVRSRPSKPEVPRHAARDQAPLPMLHPTGDLAHCLPDGNENGGEDSGLKEVGSCGSRSQRNMT